jgi:branched-subunit amino acid transport protein
MNPMEMNQTDAWTLGVIVGLMLVTLVTRCFFFISSQPWQLPHWAQRGLQYAPIAALSAVVLPEVVMTQGYLIHTWLDARVFAAAAGAAYFFARKGQGQAVLGTIVTGMLVYLPLHIGWGW